MTEEKHLPFRCGEDFASSWLEDELEIVTPFYSAPGTFMCRPSRGRKAGLAVPVKHVLGQFASLEALALLEQLLGKHLTPSHRVLLARWDGVTLFAPQDADLGPAGLRLYSVAELPDSHRAALNYIKPERHDQLLVIGEMLGTNTYLAVDCGIPTGGESPIVMVGEGVDASAPVELSIVANTLPELLMHLMEAPAVMLERLGGMRFETKGKTWVPVTYKMG